jgi:hypothetical protein
MLLPLSVMHSCPRYMYMEYHAFGSVDIFEYYGKALTINVTFLIPN